MAPLAPTRRPQANANFCRNLADNCSTRPSHMLLSKRSLMGSARFQGALVSALVDAEQLSWTFAVHPLEPIQGAVGMGSVELYHNGQMLGRFPSPHAAARWLISCDPPSSVSDGGEWSFRVLRAWASKGGRCFLHHRDPASPMAPTALQEEAKHIRAVGWSG